MNMGIETSSLPARPAFAEPQSRPKAASISSRTPRDTASYRGNGKGTHRSRGGNPAGGEEPEVSLFTHILIRGLGLLSIGLSAFAIIWLHRLFYGGTPANPTLSEYALAILAFVAGSLGSGLLILGRHIYDRIEVAERWRRRW